jgi:CRISPR/Cas system-associated exonuclease Cas4 (RecB family)
MIAQVNSVRVTSPPPPVTKANPIETLQKTISASRLNCWLSCRLKFYFRYVQEIVKPPTPAVHVGAIVHLVLQNWNMARWKKQAFELQRFRKLFDDGWADQPGKIDWENEETAQKNTAWSLLETYFTETPIKAAEMPEAVEVPMEADLSKHGLPTLIGVLDLVRAGGRIVDFKTSGRTPSAEDAIHQNEVQLSCYSILYREATGKLESGRELHHLVKTKTPKLIITQLGPMDERQQTRLFKTMESYVEGVARQDFVPSPGIQCSSCEFRTECRLWC